MKVLFVSPRQLWPAHSGANLRDLYLARQLAKRCTLTYLEMRPQATADAPPGPDLGFEVLTVVKDRPYTPGKVIRGVVGPKPLPVVNYDSPRILAYLRQLVAERQFDTVQIENSHLSTYVQAVADTPNRPALVSDWHNIESTLWFRYADNASLPPKKWLSRRTGEMVRNVEAQLLAVCDAHTVCSSVEKDQLLERAPGADVQVIPNGVDTGYFAETAAGRRPASPPRFLFVGALDYRPNIDGLQWFVKEIWPGFSSRRPDARFVVVGRSPVPAVTALASDTVEIAGPVGDLRPYYATATAAVVPLRIGAGTRLKILEAMAAGTPVISTTIGAEGIEAQHGRDFLAADNGRDFADAMDKVAGSQMLCQELTAGGLGVARRYDWTVIAEPLVGLHERLAEARAARGSLNADHAKGYGVLRGR